MARQPNYSKNAYSALGRPGATGTVFAVWLTGIALGALVLVLIVGWNAFGDSHVTVAQRAASDYNDVNQVSGATLDQYAAEGQRLFAQKGCGNCHAQGGRAAGAGPILARSHNARDLSYIHSIVRNGACGPNNTICGMPAFRTTEAEAIKYYGDGTTYFISNDEIYKIAVYLRTIQQAPRGGVAPDYVPPTVRPAS